MSTIFLSNNIFVLRIYELVLGHNSELKIVTLEYVQFANTEKAVIMRRNFETFYCMKVSREQWFVFAF